MGLNYKQASTVTNDNSPSTITIAGKDIKPGQRLRFDIPVAQLFDYTEMNIPIEVIRGVRDGPCLFISGAIHGDEINGPEIIRRLLEKKKLLRDIRGTLILLPIVNVFGYNRYVRYLPDRRDLNRCFPGSRNGPLGNQIAHILMREIVCNATHGIDLHTAAIHRTNLPQIRAHLDDPGTKMLAEAFGVPVVINADLRDGSLRQAAAEHGLPMLLFEGGEALRYDDAVTQSALRGIINVMGAINMIDAGKQSRKQADRKIFIARSSHWVRAPHSGSLRLKTRLGRMVQKGQVIGVISDPFGDRKIEVKATKTGIVIGMTTVPLVNSGDALFHIATFSDSETVEEHVEYYGEQISEDSY